MNHPSPTRRSSGLAAAAAAEEEELLLSPAAEMPAESTPASQPPEAEAAPQPPTRPAPRVATGGTLFARMSNLSRGNARTTPNDEEDNSGHSGRTEERREGNACVSRCRSRWSPAH